jgi:FAD/FMN-containing dehydrogenase
MSDLFGRILSRLRERLSDRVSTSGENGYAEATAIWAKPTGQMPWTVAHRRTVEDVQMAIRAARDCDLRLSVRGGGHDWAGRALCNGLVIDRRGMNGVMGGSDRTPQVSGGALVAEIVAATHPHGFAVVTGAVGAAPWPGLRWAALQ